MPRAREIKVRAFDRKGERIELRAHDFPARVIQHETDHLDGVLFFDRMRTFETLTFLDEYSLSHSGTQDCGVGGTAGWPGWTLSVATVFSNMAIKLGRFGRLRHVHRVEEIAVRSDT